MNFFFFFKQIHYAAACKATGPLEYLLSQNADPWAPDHSGTTPLMVAVELGRFENVELLTRGNISQKKSKKILESADLHQAMATALNAKIKKNPE